MKIDFKIDTEAFESALVRYKVACGRAWSFVLRQQTRLVAEKLMKFTPPKNLGTGKKHVAADIGKVFADLGNAKWRDKSLDKMWKAGNFEGVKTALSNHPDRAAFPIFRYRRILPYPIKNIHRAAISKSGRVPKGFQTACAVGGMFSGIGSQILGALGVSAGIAGISALTQKTIEFGGHVKDMANQLRMGKSEFGSTPKVVE